MDHESTDQDMAQIMGFSSFGAQDRPQKKRKYNAGTDAAVGVDAQPASTGSNSTPLGPRTESLAGQTANADEIELGDSDGDEIGHAPPTAATTEDANVDTAQSESGLVPPPHGVLPQRPATGPGLVGSSGAGGNGRAPNERRRRGEGSSGQSWYDGYYDTLSNRNPWEVLERQMGLQPRGTWLSAGDHTTRTAPA